MDMMLIILFLFLELVGIALVFLPVFPALSYMFLVAFLFGYITHFAIISLTNIYILASIVAGSILLDYFSGVIGAKYGGASGRSMLYGFVGLIVGTVIMPPFGGLIGLFAGVFFGEIKRRQTDSQALKAALGALGGSVIGMIVNIFLALAFFTIFTLFIIF